MPLSPDTASATAPAHTAAPHDDGADLLALALAAHREGRLPHAEALYRQLLGVQPGHFGALQLLAALTAQRGRPAAALPLFERARAIAPRHAPTLNNLGNALAALDRGDEALACYDRAIALEPAYADAHFNRGNVQLALGRPADAVSSYDRALQLERDHVEALHNRGTALAGMQRPAEALRDFDRALALRPDHAGARQSRGVALGDLGRHAEALACFDEAIGLAPDAVALRVNRALLLLLLGDLPRGWAEHEWRLHDPELSAPPLALPRWSGESLVGRTILLRSEQGLGDTLQFVRYAPLLRQRGARVIVCCPRALLPLLGRCDGIDALVAEGDPLPDADCWTPLMSVPGLVGTELDTIPAPGAYLTADPERLARWAPTLAEVPGFRVAIAWQGNPAHRGDATRSLPLEAFAHLAAVPGVRLISVQRGPGVEQLAGASFDVVRFDDLDVSPGAFMDTAAILRAVDLVVCCDTSMAHLAGALGVPTWLALASSADWRWLLDRDDSPWYPSLRLFRQRVAGDWDGVLRDMAGALRQQVAA